MQSEYSLWERNLEDKVIPLLRELDIGLVPFSPLGRGFLTGCIKRAEEYSEGDFRKTDPRFQGKNYDSNMRIVATINALAKQKNATSSQIAIAWLLYKGKDLVPIPGTKKRTYLEENIAAAKILLSEEEVKKLSDSLPEGTTAGKRYSEKMMAFINR